MFGTELIFATVENAEGLLHRFTRKRHAEKSILERHPVPIVYEETDKHDGKPEASEHRIKNKSVHHNNYQHAVKLDNRPTDT